MKKLYYLLGLIFFLIYASASLHAEDNVNPFSGGATAKPAAVTAVTNASPFNILNTWLIPWQKKITDFTTQAADDFMAGKGSIVLFFLIFISFIYGIIHAIGPNHGKTVVASAVMVGNIRPRAIIIAAVVTGLIDSGVALVIAAGVYFIFRVILSVAIAQITLGVNLASSILITIMGLIMLIDSIQHAHGGEHHHHFHIPFFKHKHHDHHDHGEHSEHTHGGVRGERFMITLAAIAAIPPCPQAIGIFLYTAVNGSFYLGIIAVLAIAVGTSLVVFAAGMTSYGVKKFGKHKLSNKGFTVFANTLAIIGASVILLLGLLGLTAIVL